ncbi:Pregnancy-associated glycoprotein [Symbiodinium microadriaticum]|uniref:Pregnancy-associated glycoprotein n=1 Tax=Symbiodinium microadriaticum TaxID=2951 RepID=A0A1Q9EDY1_SYMMI|nr:Pregnancy-associated glycoprotein [Symbiodinium microadriaticum]
MQSPAAFLAFLAALLATTTAASDLESLFMVPLQKQYVPIRRDGSVVSYKTAYSGQIYVGFRETQNFSVVFDTGPWQFSIGSRCLLVRHVHPVTLPFLKFNARRRHLVLPWYGRRLILGTFHIKEVAISFGTGSIRGNFVEELVCFSEPKGTEAKPDNGCARINLVTATEMTDEPFSSFSFDGVVGLGLGALAVEPNFSIFQQLTKITHSSFMPQFAYFLSEHDDLPSEISFGGHNPKRMQSALRWVPVFKPELGFWQVRILRASVDGKELDFCRDGDCVAIADTGTSLLGAPRQFTQQLHRLLARRVPQTPEPSDDLDCRDFPGPDILFELEGGVEVRLGGREYSRPAPMKVPNAQAELQTVCRASLLPVDPTPSLGAKAFILGEPMLRKYYTVYDWERTSVGFALARHGKDESREVVHL